MKCDWVPNTTRFMVPIYPEDGSAHRSLWAELDAAIVPDAYTTVSLDSDCGISAVVRDVQICPTCDPCIFVTCRALTPANAEEAAEIIRVAEGFGWHVE